MLWLLSRCRDHSAAGPVLAPADSVNVRNLTGEMIVIDFDLLYCVYSAVLHLSLFSTASTHHPVILISASAHLFPPGCNCAYFFTSTT